MECSKSWDKTKDHEVYDTTTFQDASAGIQRYVCFCGYSWTVKTDNLLLGDYL